MERRVRHWAAAHSAQLLFRSLSLPLARCSRKNHPFSLSLVVARTFFSAAADDDDDGETWGPALHFPVVAPRYDVM
uniref:Putative secreted protein n=1 Tax=Anopheles marajoara TaxID=58244 RepID=A0A2M4CDE3_9DIPT